MNHRVGPILIIHQRVPISSRSVQRTVIIISHSTVDGACCVDGACRLNLLICQTYLLVAAYTVRDNSLVRLIVKSFVYLPSM